MKLTHPDSLGATLDAVNAAFFYGIELSKSERLETARWIAARQGLPGSYHGLFAPLPRDWDEGVHVFTGESRQTRAGTSHILGEEACRALSLLNVSEPSVCQALERATASVAGFGPKAAEIEEDDEPAAAKPTDVDARRTNRGFFCCGACTVALWRSLNASGLPDAHDRIVDGIRFLSSCRDGQGRWRIFPFYYTLLALTEFLDFEAREEICYASTVCERILQRTVPAGDMYGRRRQALAERALHRCWD